VYLVAGFNKVKVLIGSLRNPANAHLRTVSDTLVKQWHLFKEEQQHSVNTRDCKDFKKSLSRFKDGETSA